ncbi:MAG: c-type cytochrome [Pirellulales bacterium]|nr:c-type cytochrome [Pirellulales bacterium]
MQRRVHCIIFAVLMGCQSLGNFALAGDAVEIGVVVAEATRSGPLEPAHALADFELPDGYRIELVAAEPEVVDPIAIAFDERGRIWIVEMRDYPTLEPGQEPSSRIRVLEDRDGDGLFETGGTFADGLVFPTGLQLWRGGAIVTLAGEIAYFPDENQDGRADRQETWYQGFATGNEQLRANHPQLAADGWVYVAGGLRGGEIRDLRQPDAPPVSINGRDFAFDPTTGSCRAVTGNGQFGLTFDDIGRRFTCSNRNPLFEVMFEQRYLDLNPKLVLPHVVHDVAAAGAASRLYPRTRALTTSAQHAGQFTAACGVELFRGDGLPATALGSAFVCEPTANLVHREIVLPAGAAMTARPGEHESEFLTATDEWFRPVNLQTGPDGALYVVDMYRAVIEHPEWMSEELRERADMRDGNDRGRIYRVVADRREADAKRQALPERPDELVALLDHPNAWHRETAARLLLETGADVSTQLRELATRGDRPAGRYLALSALARLGKLDDAALQAALDDPAPGVRTLALVLAESRLASSPELAAKVLGMAEDSDARVRFQVALSSMTLPSAQAAPALTAIARRDASDQWSRRAVALASRDQAGALVADLMRPDVRLGGDDRSDDDKRRARLELMRELVNAVVAAGDAGQLAEVLAIVGRLDAVADRELLLASADALEQRGRSMQDALVLVAERSPKAHAAIEHLFDGALQTVAQSSAGEADRIEAARLLRLDARDQVVPPLLGLLAEEAPPAVQVAAIGALRSHSQPVIAEFLLEHFPLQLPTARRASLEVMVADTARATALVQAAANERIALADFDLATRQKLLQHAEPAVREAAERVFAARSQDREEVVERYQAALELTGNVARGRQVFAASCASCHRVGIEGKAIGPDIGDSALKPSAQLLTDVLDPNRAIDANFVSYTALTQAGLAHQGIITAETDGGIVLLTADGATITILRRELESLTGGKSLMPEGLEQQITVEQMADLLAFLRTWRHADDLKPQSTAIVAPATR